MKTIYLTIAFVFAAFVMNAQSSELVKVLVHKDQLSSLAQSADDLESEVVAVREAYDKQDNYTCDSRWNL